MDGFVCPFCLTFAPGPHVHCGGSFLSRDHPSSVRPILIELNDDGSIPESEQPRLVEARESYRRVR